MGTFAGIYINIVFDAQPMMLHLILGSIQVCCLVIRLTYSIPGIDDWALAYDLPWILICIAIIGLISANQHADFK